MTVRGKRFRSLHFLVETNTVQVLSMTHLGRTNGKKVNQVFYPSCICDKSHCHLLNTKQIGPALFLSLSRHHFIISNDRILNTNATAPSAFVFLSWHQLPYVETWHINCSRKDRHFCKQASNLWSNSVQLDIGKRKDAGINDIGQIWKWKCVLGAHFILYFKMRCANHT